MKQEDEVCEKLRALLGLFVLEITVRIPPSSKFKFDFCFYLSHIYRSGSLDFIMYFPYLIYFLYYFILYFSLCLSRSVYVSESTSFMSSCAGSCLQAF